MLRAAGTAAGHRTRAAASRAGATLRGRRLILATRPARGVPQLARDERLDEHLELDYSTCRSIGGGEVLCHDNWYVRVRSAMQEQRRRQTDGLQALQDEPRVALPHRLETAKVVELCLQDALPQNFRASKRPRGFKRGPVVTCLPG